MKPTRTLSEARALAEARQRRERPVDPAHAKALAHWRRPSVLTRWMVQQKKPRFPMTYCSQCGCELGPGDAGVSHCSDHRRAA